MPQRSRRPSVTPTDTTARFPLCADAPRSRVEGDFFYAAAFAAGVAVSEYDARDIGTIIDTRTKRALRDPGTRQRFDALWADISGGPRPMVAAGVRISYDIIWTTAISNTVTGEDGNDGVQYKLGPSAGEMRFRSAYLFTPGFGIDPDDATVEGVAAHAGISLCHDVLCRACKIIVTLRNLRVTIFSSRQRD